MKLLRPVFAALLLSAGLAPAAQGQTTVKKVVLQGFWWDYRNDNFPSQWANYLTELAPRLKELGIDAVWIPPSVKNNGGTNSVGYAPFDAYDLGDKFQKGTTPTRLGSKDELLRLIAVLHANGIEVVQDVVLNHVDGAGTATGAGGLDPDPYSVSANGGFKNFRNACWATPVPEAGDNATAYLSRVGRWPKNYTNFHAHAGHNTTSGDFAVPYFGPDFCYGDDGGTNGFGPSSNAIYNPAQASGYSRTEARRWVLWMKKQTGIDGIRWDAVKNYAYAPQQDWTYNLKYLNGFANGGEAMLSTGEYVGSKSELDSYTTSVNSQNGGTDFATGTFDFGLRGAIYNMVASGGSYNLGLLPGEQQQQRVAYYAASNTYVHRTAPFVNSHDTFRPILSAQGNYTGWNTAQELGAHIEPNDIRLAAAYAVSFAVDGNPHVFLEDLFNIGYQGNRFSHLPTDRTALPVRSDLANIIWCHQHLNFKDGAYLVREQSADHLVIERGGRALIGINDNFNTWQNATVTTSFAPGTVLEDYSGANGSATRTVGAGGSVSISTPPCDGTAGQGRRGYAIWAPVGQAGSTYTPPRAAATTQEWELADDLGDSSCGGLGQGGALPTNSTASRTAGRIFARAGQPVSYVLYPEDNATNTRALEVRLTDAAGATVSSATGTTSIGGTYTPAADSWLTLRVRNTTATQAGQRAYVQATYQAPAGLDTRNPLNAPAPRLARWTANAGTADVADCRNWEDNVLPTPLLDVLIPAAATPQPVVAGGFFFANHLTIETGTSLTVRQGATAQLFGDLTNDGTLAGNGTWLLTGLARTAQVLGGSGPLTFSKLFIQNDSANVVLAAPATVRDSLTLRRGRVAVGDFNLTVPGAVLEGGPTSYVLTRNLPGNSGYLQRIAAPAVPTRYPVGTAGGYAPFTVESGAAGPVGVRTFEGIFANASSGPPYSAAATFVNRTWVVVGVAAPGGPGPATFGWSAADENPSFQRFQAAAYSYQGNTWTLRSGPAVATGTGPYAATLPNIAPGNFYAIGNFGPLATRTTAGPPLLTIFPNPSAGTVTLSSPGSTTQLRLSLKSLLGQELLPATSGTLPDVQARLNAALQGAAAGVYVVSVEAEGRTQHLRLVRE